MSVWFNTWKVGEFSDETEAKYKKFFADNGIKIKRDVASYYEAKGIVIAYSCPNWWPVVGHGTLELAKEYYATLVAWRVMHEGLPKGSGESGPDGTATGSGGGGGGGSSSSSSGSSSSSSSSSSSNSSNNNSNKSTSSEKTSSENSSGTQSTSPAVSDKLALTDTESNVYDASQHVAAVNASVKQELNTRVQVQEQLQTARDKEWDESVKEAYQEAEDFINKVKSCAGDVMTIATSIPAVIEQTASTVQADDELEKESPNRDSDGGTEESSPMENEATDQPTESQQPDTSEEYEVIDLHRGNCGGRKKTKSELQGKIISDAAIPVAEQAVSVVNGLTDSTDKSMMAPQEVTDAAKAKELAGVDTGKDVQTSMTRRILEKAADLMTEQQENGDLTLRAKLLWNLNEAATAIGHQVNAVLNGVPNGNLCATQEVTLNSIMGGLMANTILDLMDSWSVTSDILGMIQDASGWISFTGTDILNAISNMDQLGRDIMALGKFNSNGLVNGTAPCRPSLDSFGLDKSVFMEAGLSLMDQTGILEAGQITGTVIHDTEVLVDRSKNRLRELNPFARDMGTYMSRKPIDMVNYGKMTNRGIKVARTTMGTSRQNMLTSVLDTIKESDTSSTTCADIKRPAIRTTSASCNRHNCYSRVSFSI